MGGMHAAELGRWRNTLLNATATEKKVMNSNV